MTLASVFRLTSLSKAVVCIAVLALAARDDRPRRADDRLVPSFGP